LSWYDAAITLAVLVATVCWVFNIYITVVMGGRHTYFVELNVLEDVARVSFVFLTLSLWSVTMVKISVCLMLLRIKVYAKSWLIGLCAMIGTLFPLACSITICNMLMCRPIEANRGLLTLTEILGFTYAFLCKLIQM
jgi:hypothetical protein